MMFSHISLIIFAALVGALSFTVNGRMQNAERDLVIPEIIYHALAGAIWAILVFAILDPFIAALWKWESLPPFVTAIHYTNAVNLIATVGAVWAPQIFRWLKHDAPAFAKKLWAKWFGGNS